MKLILFLGIALTCGAVSPAHAASVSASSRPGIAATNVGQGTLQGRPVDNLERFARQKYPGCSILDEDWDDGLVEVKISHRGTDKFLLFDHSRHWLRTVWELRREQLPKAVVRALATLGFAYRHLDDNDNMAVDTPMGRFYAVQVDTDRRDGIYIVSDKGRIVHRYTSDGWNDGRLRGEDPRREWESEWNEREWDENEPDKREWEPDENEREWDDGEDHFDEGDDEWDHHKKPHKRRHHRDEDEDEDDGEDHFDEGDDEWDWFHPQREA